MSADKIEDADPIGRCCFFEDQARRTKPRRGFIKRSFIDSEMSVDHLLDADLRSLTEIHDREGASRPVPLAFYGWYVFEAGVVRHNGGEVVPDKTDENPQHANVVSPDPAEGQDALDQFFKEISENAHWQEREDLLPVISPPVREFLEQAVEGFD